MSASAKTCAEDAKTTPTGAVREFHPPPLTPGKRYTYEIRARWTENGREVTQTRNVPVTAGRVNVGFRSRPRVLKRPRAANERRRGSQPRSKERPLIGRAPLNMRTALLLEDATG